MNIEPKQHAVWIAGILLAGVLALVLWPQNAPEPIAEKSEPTSSADRALREAVMTDPASFDAHTPPEPLPVPEEPSSPASRERVLLSTIQPSPPPQALPEPVPVESLYFWEDFASLRTEAIHDPDSSQNRAGVVALMNARKARLQKEGQQL